MKDLIALILLSILCSLAPPAAAAPGPIQAVSVAGQGMAEPRSATGDSGDSLLSPDGRFVMFLSNADNLATNDHNGPVMDVFLRDRQTGGTILVSVNVAGTGGGNGDSSAPDFTPDGRFVAFESRASNLVAGDTNGAADVFVRDLVEGSTTLVSVNSVGAGAGHGVSSGPVITPDGRFVAFSSTADDLVEGDTNRLEDVFVRDLLTGAMTLISRGAQGFAFGARSESPAISRTVSSSRSSARARILWKAWPPNDRQSTCMLA